MGQIKAGQAANAQGIYEQRINERNATMDERARTDTITRGETAQLQHYRQLSQRLGESRVKNSAAGLDVSFGSAANLENDISLIGFEDSRTLSENTRREAMGYDISAANSRAAGEAARMKGKAALTAGYFGAAGTILGAASQIGQINKK